MSTASPIPHLTDEELLVALANTGHGGPDELRDADAFRAWWGRLERGPAASDRGAFDLEALRAARDLVRNLTLRNSGVDVDIDVAALGHVPLRLVVSDAPDLAPGPRADLGEVVAARAAAALVRTAGRPGWKRLKACPGPGCGWVFADRSRNGSRRWCQMSECGNRAKGAAFRKRARSAV